MRTLSAIFGIVLGAVATSLVNFVLHVVFAPQLLNDGLYVMLIYLFYAPQGAWLGGFMGYALATRHDPNHRQAGITLFIGSIGLVIAALLFAFSDPTDHWGYLSGYFGISLLWATGLIIWAIIWAKSKPSVV